MGGDDENAIVFFSCYMRLLFHYFFIVIVSYPVLFFPRLERKREQILKEMAKLENVDSGDGGGDSDTGSKDDGKESGRSRRSEWQSIIL